MTADVVANDSANTYTQAGYTVTASSQYIGNGTIYRVWKIFDEKLGGSPAGETWIQGDLSAYDINGDYVLSPANNLGTGADDGEWVKLELPNKITLERIHITPRDSNREPEDFKIYGSIDNVNWVEILSETGASPAITTGTSYMVDVRTTSYKYLGMVIKKIVGSGYFAIDNLELYGYEEGSGSLDTTLKSVYNVPATTGTQLEVYYDGRDYTQTSDFTGTGGVVDKAGGDQDGTAGTGVTFDTTYKAFVFDASGSGTVTTSKITSSTLPSTFVDNAHHSVAMWFKLDTITGEHTLFTIKDNTNGFSYQTPHVVIDEGILRYDFWSNNIQLLDQIVANEWYHLVITFSGGNHQSGTKFYINGVHNTNVSTPSGTDNLDIQVNSVVYLGGSISSYERGIDGSVANFRLYSKALNAGQVQELYDYQKDYFLGSKSQVTLYKGHLGVGVTEPSGQLELAGDERIQEYPPRALTGYETLMEGHGVFCAYASSGYTSGSTQNRLAYKAFDKASGSGGLNDIWQSVDSLYNGGSGTNQPYTGSVRLAENLPKGHYLGLKMPYPVKITSFVMGAYFNSGYRAVGDGLIVGRNTNNPTWEVVHTLTNSFMAGVNGFNIATNAPAILITTPSIPIDNTKYYDEYALVVTGTLGSTLVTVSEWRLFGTPGPTTLDKGSLSLTRSLDVPRVSRYDVDTETPRPEKLVVDFDTTVNSSPTDISGKGNHGTMTSGVSHSPADKAFKWDSSTGGRRIEVIGVPTATGAGNFLMSVSMWFKLKTTGAVLWGMVGDDDGTDGSPTNYSAPHAVVNSAGNITWAMWGNDLTNQTAVVVNRWYHCVWTYSGGTTGRKMFLDGVEQTFNIAQTHALNMVNATSRLVIGIYPHDLATYPLNGYVSNFKLYDVALEPSEVQKLYRLGRTGRSMVISDTAVGIGKVPEAQLDVRGNLKLDGVVMPKIIAGHWTMTGANPSVVQIMVNESNCVTSIANGSGAGQGQNMSGNRGRFTAPVTGLYHFSTSCTMATRATSGYLGTMTQSGGAIQSSWPFTYAEVFDFRSSSNEEQSYSFSKICKMDAGDYITLQTYGPGYTDNSVVIHGSIHLIYAISGAAW